MPRPAKQPNHEFMTKLTALEKAIEIGHRTGATTTTILADALRIEAYLNGQNPIATRSKK